MKDLSYAYTNPDFAAKQRSLVNIQLADMYEGKPPNHFDVLGRMFAELRSDTRLPHVTVLDAGCGAAYYSEIIEHYAPEWMKEYHGVDFNRAMIQVARAFYPGLRIHFGDLRNLNMFGGESFDIVLSGAAIVHIAEWEDAVMEFARIARRFLILHRTRIQDHPHPGYKIETREHCSAEIYWISFDEQHLCRFVEALEFKLVRSVPTGETDMFTYLFRRKF